MGTYLIHNRHDARDCTEAFGAIESAVVETDIEVRDDTLVCMCPHDLHGGILLVEADEIQEAEDFARVFNVGVTTVHGVDECYLGEKGVGVPEQLNLGED